MKANLFNLAQFCFEILIKLQMIAMRYKWAQATTRAAASEASNILEQGFQKQLLW